MHEAASNHQPNVLILATGGTIAGAAESTTKTAGYSPGVIDVQSLLIAIPEVNQVANISARQVFDNGSPDIPSTLLVELSHELQSQLDTDEYDGVVITHGTDTIEETAFFLDLTIKSSKPIVLVGAMRPSTARSADGPMNLLQAVTVAASRKSRDRGVLIVFNDQILPAFYTTKTSANAVDTFKAGDHGSLGTVKDSGPLYYYPPHRPTGWRHFDIKQLDPKKGLPKVSILYGHLDLEEGLVESCLQLGAKGVVLAGMGAGCWTTSGGGSIEDSMASKGHFPVVASFRTSWGYVSSFGGIYGLGHYAIGSGFLNPPKARIQLQLCLALRMSHANTKESFSQ